MTINPLSQIQVRDDDDFLCGLDPKNVAEEVKRRVKDFTVVQITLLAALWAYTRFFDFNSQNSKDVARDVTVIFVLLSCSFVGCHFVKFISMHSNESGIRRRLRLSTRIFLSDLSILSIIVSILFFIASAIENLESMSFGAHSGDIRGGVAIVAVFGAGVAMLCIVKNLLKNMVKFTKPVNALLRNKSRRKLKIRTALLNIKDLATTA